jgi:hypothetical protein
MTVGIAWVGKRRDGREHLYIATDSRTRGAYTFDSCPKILTLPRSDCALGFAGSTSETYPLMLQMAYAIAAHEPASDRSLDIVRVKEHLLKIFTDLIRHHDKPATPLTSGDAQFLFAGYSWRSKDYRIWTINYSERENKFVAREARTFISRLRKAAFIGDWSTRLRNKIASEFGRADGTPLYLEPLTSISNLIAAAGDDDSIGGPPQLIRITEHMNTRPLCVRWRGQDTLFGRPLFDYENIDYWMVDPTTHRFQKPRKFGNRSHDTLNDAEDEQDALENETPTSVAAPAVE